MVEEEGHTSEKPLKGRKIILINTREIIVVLIRNLLEIEGGANIVEIDLQNKILPDLPSGYDAIVCFIRYNDLDEYEFIRKVQLKAGKLPIVAISILNPTFRNRFIDLDIRILDSMSIVQRLIPTLVQEILKKERGEIEDI